MADYIRVYDCQPCVIFFFSSRRRHTRCGRDWSSDVCSSDLVVLIFLIIVNLIGGIGLAQRVDERFVWVAIVVPAICLVVLVLSFMGLIDRRSSRGRDSPSH